MIDEDEREDIHNFFNQTENFTFDDARIEFDEEIFNDEEIRLLRIDYISHVAN